MTNDLWTFDPRIADAIINARILHISPLQEIAASSINLGLSDKEWEAIRPTWEWHDGMTTTELQRRRGVNL